MQGVYSTCSCILSGVPHTLAICYCNIHFGYYLVPGLSSQFLPYSLHNLLSVTEVVSNVLEEWLQDLVSFGNPCL